MSKEITKHGKKQSVRDKWIANKDWLNKMEHRRKANYNHYNLPRRMKNTTDKYHKKKNQEDKISKGKTKQN